MPNWAFNSLSVSGEPKDIKAFKTRAKKGKNPLSFEKFLPTPKALLKQQSPPKTDKIGEGNLKKYGAIDWYSWRVKNWGTKWDTNPDNTELDHSEPKCLEYHFDTAWSSPDAWLKSVSTMYPRLTFELFAKEEANMWPKFTAIVKNGDWQEVEAKRR